MLERGTTVELARGGHVTPLAHDTLRERRITVAAEGRTPADHASLAPAAVIRSVAIASDWSGSELRRPLVAFLRGRGLAVDDQGRDDQGPDGPDPAGYPDIAARVARTVARGEADTGIIIDASGSGSAIAANKIPGIRAAAAFSEPIARDAREHAGANVLTLGALFLTADQAVAIVSVWLTTPMRDPAAMAHLARIRDLENR